MKYHLVDNNRILPVSLSRNQQLISCFQSNQARERIGWSWRSVPRPCSPSPPKSPEIKSLLIGTTIPTL